MAEYRFQVLDLETDLENSVIRIACSLDVDEDTVSSNIYLTRGNPRVIVPVSITVDGRQINVALNESPIPNQPYTLIIDDGIKSIVGDSIESALPFHIEFESKILSKCAILSPSNFSEADENDLKFSWQETGTPCVGKFRVEVATENAFNNLVFNSLIDNSASIAADGIYAAIVPAANIADLRQYYIRIRAEDGADYGAWSETITFVRPKEAPVVPNPQPAEEKKRPELPNVTDLTKDTTTEVATDVSRETPKVRMISSEKTVYDDALPTEFVIELSDPVQVTDMVVKLERRDI